MIDSVVIKELRERIEGASRGERARLVAEVAQGLQMSAQALYRAMQERPPQPGKSGISEEMVLAIWGFKERSAAHGQAISTEAAYEKAVVAGKAPAGLSVSSLNRRARQLKLNRQIDPAIRMEASRPNEVHQVDFSGSRYFRPIYRDGRWYLVVRHGADRSRKKEPLERNRAWCGSLKDDYSRCFYMQYFVAPGGEAVLDALRFLSEAWKYKGPGFPLHGLPEQLYCDQGSFRKSKVFQVLIERLEIGLPGRAPYNKRAGGKIENTFKQLKGRFEALFLDEIGAVYPLEEINQRLLRFCFQDNERLHPFYRDKPRWERWLEIGAGVRQMPDDIWRYTFVNEQRVVDKNMLIWVGGAPYKAPPDSYKQKIEVWYSLAGEMKFKDPQTGQVFDAVKYLPVRFGEYRAEKLSRVQRLKKESRAIVEGITVEPFVGAKNKEQRTKITYLVPRGTDKEYPDPVADARKEYISLEEALRVIAMHIRKPLTVLPMPVQEKIKLVLQERGLAQEAVNELARELASKLK